MKKTDLDSTYNVDPSERITIKITPRDGAGEGNVTARSDAADAQFFKSTTPRLTFSCSAIKDNAVTAIVSCAFPGNISDDANFLIEVSGKPDEDTDSLVVRKSD